jgi:hypothetical protein
MPTIYRVTGLPKGTTNSQKREIEFVLQTGDGNQLEFVTDISAAKQIASALGTLAKRIPQSKAQAVTAEEVISYGAQREAFGSHVLLKLITKSGVPHMFAIPLAGAVDIGARLQKESAKKGQKPGMA